MKLRQLFENIYEETPQDFDGKLKIIGVCFGRFNPPHRGHKAVWQAAATNPIWYVGTNETTSGPKDPLPYDVKLQCMAAVWPKVAGHVIPEQSLLTLASRIYDEHGGNVHLKVYTDEQWLVKTLTQYNGVEKEHGMYRFNQIDWVKTERLASATNLRAAVRAGDRNAFYKDMGIKPSVAIEVNGAEHPVFDVVAHFLNKYPEKVKKGEVAEEFGVGKITAQNTTADVNASTPGKNLRAFKLAEQIASMEQELSDLREGKSKKPRKAAEYAGQSAIRMRDVGGYDRTYHLNRIMMATAMADGQSTKAVDSHPDTWFEKYNTAFPYTQEEYNMLRAAMKTVPTDGKVVSKFEKSMELPSTNTQSTVAKPKKNKYGV